MKEVFIIKTVDVPESVQYFSLDTEKYSYDVVYWVSKDRHQWTRNPKFAFHFTSYTDAVAVIPLFGSDMYQIEKYFIVE